MLCGTLVSWWQFTFRAMNLPDELLLYDNPSQCHWWLESARKDILGERWDRGLVPTSVYFGAAGQRERLPGHKLTVVQHLLTGETRQSGSRGYWTNTKTNNGKFADMWLYLYHYHYPIGAHEGPKPWPWVAEAREAFHAIGRWKLRRSVPKRSKIMEVANASANWLIKPDWLILWCFH
jgi:hypothetical protein